MATATTHGSVGFAACCTLVYGSQFLGPAAGDLFLCKAVPIVDIQDGHSWEKRRNSDLKGVTRDIPRRLLLLLCLLCCSLCVAFIDSVGHPRPAAFSVHRHPVARVVYNTSKDKRLLVSALLTCRN